MMSETISEMWEELKKIKIDDKNSPFLRRDFKKIEGTIPINFSVAKSILTNDVGILIDSKEENFPKEPDISLSENFEIKIYNSDNGNKYLWFYLKKNTGYEKQFEIICYDIIEKACKINDITNIVQVFLDSIKNWQIFLKEKKELLKDSQIKGLFSELFFLKKILIPNIGVKKSIESWKPIDKTHDFVVGNLSVEIKSTTSGPIKSIKINSLKQLDETLVKNLYLYVLQMGENKGSSLPEIVKELREIIKKNSVEHFYMFENKLIEEKYYDIFEDKYKNRMFFKNNEYVFKIMDDFPRLRNCDLQELNREGIINGKYEINFSSCEAYKISMDKFIKSL